MDTSIQEDASVTFRWNWFGQLQSNQIFVIELKKQEESSFREIGRTGNGLGANRDGEYSLTKTLNALPGHYTWRVLVLEDDQIIQSSEEFNLDVTEIPPSKKFGAG